MTDVTIAPTDTAHATPRRERAKAQVPGVLLGVLRIALSWQLLWSGLDKVFGLGLATEPGKAVINGFSPTRGYLEFGLDPAGFAFGALHPIAGHPVVDVLFLLGTVGAGLALLLGVGVRIAGLGAAAFMLLLWVSAFPLANNPFLDEHLFAVAAALLLAFSPAGDHLGLGRWWRSTPLVKRFGWLA
ncbi:DoxX family membrane protein [Microbacterium sp. NPDC057659]|uniref:DoxX family membrane protein n=1 Tax=Microbacterium sp. NPDC057659 TaxID=3346198 RepID=UPI0036704F48